MHFWAVKVLATALGETFADFLSEELGLELSQTDIVFSVALALLLAMQISLAFLVVPLYWACISLVSITATLLTDTLTDAHHVPLWITASAISVGVVALFAVWYRVERTVSFRSIVTARREVFYWTMVLATFALGTAAGDLFSEALEVGYVQSLTIFALVFLVIGALVKSRVIGATVAFWLAYVLPTPLGTNLADTLSQPSSNGGLGIGPGLTSALLFSTIAIYVARLSIARRRSLESPLLAD